MLNNLVLNLCNLQMKQKRLKYHDNDQYPTQEYSMQSPSQPVKSPSPDKKRSKLITPTKSPQLIDIKRNLVQSRLEDKRFDKTPVGSKPHDQSTRYYTNDDFQQYRSSHKKNEIFQQLQNMMPEEFQVDSNQMYRSAINPNSKELDYLKLLQQKQKTIKELHEIIEMINRNNSLQLSSSSVSNTKHKRIFDNSGILGGSRSESPQEQLKNQVRILTIQNQQLIHMIEKLNSDKKSHHENEKQSTKQKIDYTSHKLKQQILSRQIYQMKQSLLQKDQDCTSLIKQNKDIYNKYIELDKQNQKLIKMMKDKELSDRKYHNSLIQSSISQKSSISQSQAKEKVSIQKIKEQYNQSLKVFKDTVYGDVEEFMREIQTHTKGMQDRLAHMELQLKTLQKFRSAYHNLQKAKLIDESIGSGGKSSEKRQQFENELNEISQIEVSSPQKDRYREIESLLMEKKEQYERELSTQRRTNQQLSEDLAQLRAEYQLLEQKYAQTVQQNQRTPLSRISQSLRMSPSPQRASKSPQRNFQIQDINQAKGRQAQIQKLCQLIQKCQKQFTQQKNNLLQQISQLKDKNTTYEQIIESQRQEFEEKQNDVRTRISEKENELKRNESVYKSEIDHLRELLTEREMQQPEVSEVESLKRSLQLKEVEVQHKTTEALQLKEQNAYLKQKAQTLRDQSEQLQAKLQHIQQIQQSAKKQIKKLVENYQTELSILKSEKQSYKDKHEAEVHSYQRQTSLLRQQISHLHQELAQGQQSLMASDREIKRLSNQCQNAELLLNQTQTQSGQQIIALKQRLVQLQTKLNLKNSESRELLHSKEALQLQHSELKDHIGQLLVISKHVEEIQVENKNMKQVISEHEVKYNQKMRDNERQKQVIQSLEHQLTALRRQLEESSRENAQKQSTIDELQSTINQLQQQLSNLQSRVSHVRKQSQDIKKQSEDIRKSTQKLMSQKQTLLQQTKQQLCQKQLLLAEQAQKSLQQKAQYEFIVRQLKQQNSNLGADLSLLRDDNSLYYETHNQMLYLKQHNLLPQLYQLRSLLNRGGSENAEKEAQYDVGKLHIDYQAKLDENLLLHGRIDEFKSEVHKEKEERILLEEKINFLEKNILIYQNQLKQRKSFCQKLIHDNNKLQKQLLLIKKLKLQAKHTQTDTNRLSLLQRVNNLVKIQENRDSTLKRIQEKRCESPIRQINSLISKVEEFDTFSIKPYSDQFSR